MMSLQLLALANGCKQRDFNSGGSARGKVLISNGENAASIGHPYAKYLVGWGSKGMNHCTATCVSEKSLITAAHCLSTDMKVEGSPVPKENFHIHPDYPGKGVHKNDLAVISGQDAVCGRGVPLLGRSPKVGESFVILGYGIDSPTDRNKGFRQGTNKVLGFFNDLIIFAGYGHANAERLNPELGYKAGEMSASQGGDSGGPLLIDGSIAGVTSGGGGWNDFVTLGMDKILEAPAELKGKDYFKHSDYSDLHSPTNRCFLSAIRAKLADESFPTVGVEGLDCD